MEPTGNVGTTALNGKEYEANKDFARDVESSAEFTIGLLGQEGPTYDAGSDAFRQIDNFIDKIDDGTVNFHGSNSVQLNASANSFLNKVEAGLIQSQGDALDGGASVDDAMRFVNAAEYVFSEIAMFGEPAPAPMTPAGPAEETLTSGGASGNLSNGLALGGISQTLDQAKNADTSADKASLIQDAIAGLISALTGGGAGDASGDGGPGASPTQTGLGQTISTAIDALQGGEVAAPPPPPPPVIETTEYRGDELMGKVWAEGGQGITYDESDGGLGIDGREDDEIDVGERMIFEPGELVQGGSVTVEDLHGESGSRGSIAVMRDGEVVDTIKVNGDLDGTQTVRIDEAFDRLEFFVDGGPEFEDAIKGGGILSLGKLDGEAKTTFAVSAVSVDKEQPAAEGAPVEGTGPARLVGADGAEEIAVASEAILQLLNALAGISEAVAAPSITGSDDQAPLLDQIGSVMEALVGALEGDQGTPQMTRDELAGLLGTIGALAGQVGQTLPDDDAAATDAGISSASEALDALAGAVQGLVDVIVPALEPETVLV